MGTYPMRCRPLYTQTCLCLPYYYTSALDGLAMRHPDSCSGYLVALDGSGLVPADLLLGYPMGPDESGLELIDLALERG